METFIGWVETHLSTNDAYSGLERNGERNQHYWVVFNTIWALIVLLRAIEELGSKEKVGKCLKCRKVFRNFMIWGNKGIEI